MAKQSLGSFAAKLFGLACGFLYAVAVARLLGARGYGIVAVAMSTAAMTATIAVLGANELAVREIANASARKAWDDLRRYVSWSTRAVTATSVVAAIIMATSSLLPGPYSEALLLGSVAVPLFAMLFLLRGLVLGAGNIVAAQLPLDFVRWVVTLSLIGALSLGVVIATPAAVMVVIVVALSAGLIFAIATFRNFLRSLPQQSARSITNQNWLVQSAPFLAIALFGIVGTEIATLLLGWLSGPREAGLYQPIARLAPLMMLANEAIENALAPKIVHSWEEKNRQTIQRRVSRSARASTIATAAIVTAIVITSPYILRAFGPEFTRYQALLVWIGVAQVLNAATGAAPLLLAMTGDMKSRISAQAITMIVQVGLGILLIPPFGAAGAAASLVAAIVVWSLAHWWLALRATGIDTSVVGFGGDLAGSQA